VIVGTRTFGKASIQAIVPVPGGGALKLTVATYRTPDGIDLHNRGVRPDYVEHTRLLVHAVAVARRL
jgi:carboxyl-terminal processing protease